MPTDKNDWLKPNLQIDNNKCRSVFMPTDEKLMGLKPNLQVDNNKYKSVFIPIKTQIDNK